MNKVKVCIIAPQTSELITKEVIKVCQENRFDVIPSDEFNSPSMDKLVIFGHREGIAALEHRFKLLSSPKQDTEVISVMGGTNVHINNIHPSVIIRKVKDNKKAYTASLRAATTVLKDIYLLPKGLFLDKSDANAVTDYARSKGFKLNICYDNYLCGERTILLNQGEPTKVSTPTASWEVNIKPFNLANRLIAEIDKIAQEDECDQLAKKQDALCAEPV